MRSGPIENLSSLFDCEPYCHQLCPPDSQQLRTKRGALCSVGEASGSGRSTELRRWTASARKPRTCSYARPTTIFPAPTSPWISIGNRSSRRDCRPARASPYGIIISTCKAPHRRRSTCSTGRAKRSRWWVSSTSSTASRARWGTTISDRFGRFSCPRHRRKFHRRRGDVA